jgi:uncharacterized membrane protein YidH (DUF202 family)
VASSLIETMYASRIWVAAAIFGMAVVPIVRSFYGITIDQAVATAVVPLAIAYLLVKTIVDVTPEPKEPPPFEIRGALMTTVAAIVVFGLGLVILGVSTAISMPIYRLIHVTWVTGMHLTVIAASSIVVGIMTCAAAMATFGTMVKFVKRRGKYPTLEQLVWATLVRVDEDIHQHRSLAT